MSLLKNIIILQWVSEDVVSICGGGSLLLWRWCFLWRSLLWLGRRFRENIICNKLIVAMIILLIPFPIHVHCSCSLAITSTTYSRYCYTKYYLPTLPPNKLLLFFCDFFSLGLKLGVSANISVSSANRSSSCNGTAFFDFAVSFFRDGLELNISSCKLIRCNL